MEGEREQECHFGFHPQLLCGLDRQRKVAKKLACLVASAGQAPVCGSYVLLLKQLSPVQAGRSSFPCCVFSSSLSEGFGKSWPFPCLTSAAASVSSGRSVEWLEAGEQQLPQCLKWVLFPTVYVETQCRGERSVCVLPFIPFARSPHYSPDCRITVEKTVSPLDRGGQR